MIYIGTSGWAYPSWRPKFYSAGLPQSQFLSFYSKRLNAVEVNYTFCGRHLLHPDIAERWLAQVPEGFVFCFRGPKPITHFHVYRLRHADSKLHEFTAALGPFSWVNRLGPVLFQLPKTFHVDIPALEGFLSRWPRELRVSFEFRDPSWFTDSVFELLRRFEAALCFAERDDMQTPAISTATFTHLRLRKSRYSPSAVRQLAYRIEGYAADGDVYAFFRQRDEQGPIYAERLYAHLQSFDRDDCSPALASIKQ